MKEKMYRKTITPKERNERLKEKEVEEV